MPKRTGLNEEAIARRALVMLDEEGVDGLSMRKLATALDVSVMALYSYFTDRGALLDAVAQLVYAEVELPGPGAGPREQLRRLMHAVRRVLHTHPRSLPLVTRYPPRTTAALAFVDAGYRAVLEAGVSPAEAARCYRALAAYSIGTASVEATGYFERPPAPNDAASAAAIARALPAVAEVSPFLAGHDDEAEFDYGLDLVLDGLLNRHHD